MRAEGMYTWGASGIKDRIQGQGIQGARGFIVVILPPA